MECGTTTYCRYHFDKGWMHVNLLLSDFFSSSQEVERDGELIFVFKAIELFGCFLATSRIEMKKF